MNPFWFGNPAGVGQQTKAAQIIIGMAGGGAGRRAPKRRKAKRATARKTAVKRRRKSGARLVKGSAAAKAYMAKIRRKRRK